MRDVVFQTDNNKQCIDSVLLWVLKVPHYCLYSIFHCGLPFPLHTAGHPASSSLIPLFAAFCENYCWVGISYTFGKVTTKTRRSQRAEPTLSGGVNVLVPFLRSHRAEYQKSEGVRLEFSSYSWVFNWKNKETDCCEEFFFFYIGRVSFSYCETFESIHPWNIRYSHQPDTQRRWPIWQPIFQIVEP